MKRVTIAITTLNRPTFLEQTLGCVLAQDYPYLDILISDNGSTDDTPARAREIVGADPRVRFRRNEETAPFVEHCSQCVDAALGEYFVLLHDDDCISPGFISALMQVAERHSAVNVVVPANVLIDEEGRILKEFATPDRDIHDGVAFLLHWLTGTAPQYLANLTTVLFRTSTVRRFGAYRALGGSRNNDNLLFLQVGITSPIGFSRQAVFQWRIHASNLGDTEPAELIATSGSSFLRHLRKDPATVSALQALSFRQRQAILRSVASSTAKEVIRHLHGQGLACTWGVLRSLLRVRQDPAFVYLVCRDYLRSAFPQSHAFFRRIRRHRWLAGVPSGASSDRCREV